MKRLATLILISLIFYFSFFFILPNKVSAVILFQDDFDDGIADGWSVLSGESYWRFQDGMYGANVMPQFTVANTVADGTDYENYIYEVDMVALEGTDKNLIFRTIDLDNRYGFHVSYGSIKLEKRTSGWERDVASAPITFLNGEIYRIKVILNGNLIEIYQDDSLVLSYEDIEADAITHGKIGLRVGTGADAPSEVYYDNILVTSIEPSPTPTPTLQPLIFLPGLGASWNHGAMILDQEKPPEEWYMTPGVKSYDGIIQTFQNAGYTLGNNFFVFNYDWRQSIEDIAEDLKNYINTHINPPPEMEIDLVGHSLGGMVARTYVQNNPTDNQIDQLISLGSPYHGAPQVYYLWEGADLNKTLDFAWQRIGAGILLQLKKRNFENNVETIHNIVPVIVNLLPDFSYLKDSGSPKPLSEMNQRNAWLEGLNSLPLPEHLTSRLTAILGRKGNTLRWINIQSKSWLDRLLGRWEDGKPVSEEFEMGDGSVLIESGQLEGAAVEAIDGLNHSDLVESESGQERVMQILDLTPTEIVEAPETLSEPLLVFQLASPVNFVVFGPNGWQIGEGVTNNIPNGIYSPDDKLIIIPNPLEGDYNVQVISEDGGGDYRLLIGNLNQDNDIWRKEDGQVGGGETETHQINYSSDVKENKFALLYLAKDSLQDAEEKIKGCKYFLNRFLRWSIKAKIRQIERVISLLEQGKDKRAEIQLERLIISLTYLEKNLKFWLKFCPEETSEELKFLLRETRDYLLQAQEL